jgi:hypothetical protein
MKRIALVAVAVMVGVFTSSAMASVGASTDVHRSATSKTEWTAEYNAPGYYGAVKCTGKTVVNKKYPFGKDSETCETTEGKFHDMKAGKEQKTFETSEGGSVGEWESDSGDGKRTTTFSYRVNKALTKFKLVAIYSS